MDTTGLHNLSLALRHILQQFMDSSNSSYYKNADMTLPHDGYFQRLSWYFECDKCHYKAFYIREIENHRKVCGEIKLNEIHPGFSDVRGAANNIRRTNATSIPAARVSEGFQEELVATPHNIYTPAQDSGTPQSIAPTALVDIKTESQINMESVDFSGSGKRKKPKPKGAKRKSMKISGVSTTPCASSEKPQEVASRDFSSADSSTNNQNPWESFEHILVSADGDTKEFASQPGKVRKVRKVALTDAEVLSGGTCSNSLYGISQESQAMSSFVSQLPTSGDQLHSHLSHLLTTNEVTSRKKVLFPSSRQPRASRFDHTQCIYKCDLLVDAQTKRMIHDEFWAMSNSSRVDYCCRTITKKVANFRSRPGYKGKKLTSRAYSIVVNGAFQRVCKDFYASVHGISCSRIEAFLNSEIRVGETVSATNNQMQLTAESPVFHIDGDYNGEQKPVRDQPCSATSANNQYIT
ncbi:uncharacterized protein [Watersipora subatra]|uniref:uncharacterized protein isoform X1 n=1 Tax=Watersipora subatra TaxID=2589382 RepID=UPI00355B1C1A